MDDTSGNDFTLPDAAPYDYQPPEAAPSVEPMAPQDDEKKRSRFAAPLVIGAVLGAALLGAGSFLGIKALADDNPGTTTSQVGDRAATGEDTDGGTVTGPDGGTDGGTRPERGFGPGGHHDDGERGAPPQDGQFPPGDDHEFDDDDVDDPTPSGGGTIVGSSSEGTES